MTRQALSGGSAVHPEGTACRLTLLLDCPGLGIVSGRKLLLSSVVPLPSKPCVGLCHAQVRVGRTETRSVFRAWGLSASAASLGHSALWLLRCWM